MPSLKQCHNISDLRKRAKAKLPKPMFDYIDGGADDEWTLRRNTQAFDGWELVPHTLRNIASIDQSTKLFGQSLEVPFFLAPTGMSRLFHHEKETAACKAAERFGTLYSLSTLGTTSLEDIASIGTHPKMFQVYILKDRELTREFLSRCKASRYCALCLTVDTQIAGNRERDVRNGMSMPPKLTPASMLSYASRFEWLYNLIKNPDFNLANVAHRQDALGSGTMGLIDYVNSQFDRTVNWDDAAWLAEQTELPFVIKGIMSVADALKAKEIGASAIMISNHGGRQLDGAPAPIDCLQELRAAVGDSMELIVDGGIRRGSHVVKAIALGADACSIGRPYLYGLAAGGQAGVERTLGILKEETERCMGLVGASTIAELRNTEIRRVT